MAVFGLKKEVPGGKMKKRAGLDIGSHALKLIDISYAESKPVLAGFGLKDISELPAQKISESIKELAEKVKLTSKELVISVSGPSVIVRFITMPKMRDEELKSAVRFEAEKFIPFNIRECIVDYQILNKDLKEGKLQLLLVAVKKDFVLEKMKLVEDAGFTVKIVDVDNFALANAFLRNFPKAEVDKTFALLNIGATFTNLSILKNGAISFVRDASMGSNDFSAAVAKKMNISVLEAERLLVSPGEKNQAIIDYARAPLASLLDDIKLSFSYYENQSGGSIDEIYISGGGSALSGLNDSFQETFGSNPVFWDPLEFLGKGPGVFDVNLLDKSKSSLAIATGLALR